MDLNSNKGLFYFKGLVYELTDLLFVTVLMRQKLEKRGSGYTLTTIGKEIQEIFSSLEDKYKERWNNEWVKGGILMPMSTFHPLITRHLKATDLKNWIQDEDGSRNYQIKTDRTNDELRRELVLLNDSLEALSKYISYIQKLIDESEKE